jgi:hypothetical protein
MKRLGMLLAVLIFLAGCASSGDQSQWDDFWKDLRGDNMKMRSGWSNEDRPEAIKAYD